MVDLRSSSKSTFPRRRRTQARSDSASRAIALRTTPSIARRHKPVSSPTRKAGTTLSGRRFLIVSAPFGPFGRALAKVLASRGAQVERMIFNAADAVTWRQAGGRVFRAGREAWVTQSAQIIDDFTDVIVFGESGAYNQAVLAQAESLKAHVWVLENGYFRPDWVTIERNGVNASSRLPRFQGAYASAPVDIPSPRPVGRILPHHITNISVYHALQLLGTPLFRQFDSPYVHSPLKQCVGHIRRYIGLSLRSKRAFDADRIAARGPFFIACLQREGDAQLLRYSRLVDNSAFLAEVMRDFAQAAHPADRLVIKNHPLDPGVVNLRAVTRRLARELGLETRVDFIDGGNLASLCRASKGMVVNNSSAAMSALGFHTPVKVMGDAFFDFEGLTHQGPLSSFWAKPKKPDAELFVRFRHHVIAQTQVNGNYHEPHMLTDTASGIADVIERQAD